MAETRLTVKTCLPSKLIYFRNAAGRRGSQVVRQGSAKALCVGSIPTLASNRNALRLHFFPNPQGANEYLNEYPNPEPGVTAAMGLYPPRSGSRSPFVLA